MISADDLKKAQSEVSEEELENVAGGNLCSNNVLTNCDWNNLSGLI